MSGQTVPAGSEETWRIHELIFFKKQHTHSFIILQAPGPLVCVACYSPGISDFYSLLVSSTVLELVCVVHNNPTLLPLPFPHV